MLVIFWINQFLVCISLDILYDMYIRPCIRHIRLAQGTYIQAQGIFVFAQMEVYILFINKKHFAIL